MVEEILSLIGRKNKIEFREVRDTFNVTSETASAVIAFLVEFGFAVLDKNKKYIMLSEPYKRFMEEKNS